MDTKKIVAFLDSLNRCIFAEKVEERCTNTSLVVKNPVVVNIVAQRDSLTGQPNGQMALQLLPIFFKEFLAAKDADIIFSYNTANITQIDPLIFDFKLYAQYEQIFSNLILPQKAPIAQGMPNVGQQNTNKDSNIIKLFDE